MSIWGPYSTDNDDAEDWLSNLMESPLVDQLEEAFTEISDSTRIGYMEVTECCIAVAAADVLCQLLGVAGDQPPLGEEKFEEIKNQLINLMPLDQIHLVEQASIAVQRIIEDEEHSELRQLYEDGELELNTWLQEMKKLENRLKKILKAEE